MIRGPPPPRRATETPKKSVIGTNSGAYRVWHGTCELPESQPVVQGPEPRARTGGRERGESGESGEPIFLRINNNSYAFLGIHTRGYSIPHTIYTPGHPEGFDSIQQSGTFFTDTTPIRKLILKYAKDQGIIH